MLALALIFFALKNQGSLTQESKVDVESIALAIKWSEYLKKHAEKIYENSTTEHKSCLTILIHKILSQEIYDGQSLRSITRHNWCGLKNMNEVEYALEVLEQHFWLRVIKKTKTGRPSRVISLNPELTQSFLQQEIKYAS